MLRRVTAFWLHLRTTDNPLTVASFAFIIAGFLAVIYAVSRLGFPMAAAAPATALAMAGLLLFLPSIVYAGLAAGGRHPDQFWYTSHLAIVFWVFAAVMLWGVMAAVSGINFAPLVLWLGFISAALGFGAWLTARPWPQTVGFVLIPVILIFWLVGPVYGDIARHPLLLEGIFAQVLNVPDSLFHTAIAQMTGRYGSISTGVHGLPESSYYVASHWILYHTARLAQLHPLDGYGLIYPVVFVPLSLAALGWAAVEVRLVMFSKLAELPSLRSDWAFWAVYALALVGLLQSWPLHFIGESYNFSIWTTLLAFGLLIRFAHIKKQTYLAQQPPLEMLVFLFIVMPLMLVLIGLSKTPAMFVAAGGLGYVFIRLGLFRRWYYWLALVLVCGAVLWVFRVAIWGAAVESGAVMAPFNYLRCCVAAERRLLFYPIEASYSLFACLLMIAALRADRPIRLWVALRSKRLIFAETLLILSLIAALPGLVIALDWHSLYFWEVQRWVGAAVLLGLLPKVAGVIARYVPPLANIRWAQAVVTVFCLLLAGFFLARNIPWNLAGYINHSSSIRNAYQTAPQTIEPSLTTQPVLQLVDTYRSFSRTERDATVWAIFVALQALDKENYPNTMLYIPKSVTAFWGIDYQCFALPYFGPALSGLPMVRGFPTEGCEPFYGALTDFYHYSFYPEIIDEPIGAAALPRADLCSEVLDLGFQQVIILTVTEPEIVATDLQDCSTPP